MEDDLSVMVRLYEL